MSCALRLQSISTSKLHRRREQQGYILLTLLLAVSLFTIAAVAVLPTISQQIKRDREVELRHRGTEYMRAIEHFYRRYGRYPSRIEELENTQNAHLIRRLYKDPMSRDRATGLEKDFKVLHQMDIRLNDSPLGPAPIASEPPVEGDPKGQSGVADSGGQSGEPQPAGGLQNSIAGGFASSSFGNASNAGGNSSSSAALSSDSDSDWDAASGGPILGVVSTNTGKTIRTFFGKDHYNDWLFIYIDGLQRGGPLMGPVNPSLPRANLDSLAPLPGAGVSGQGLAPAQGSTSNTGQTQFGSQSQAGSTQAPSQQ